MSETTRAAAHGRGLRMGRSRIGWAVGVVAPWCLGVGLAVSFPADAGQPSGVGASVAALTLTAPSMPDDLVPATSAALTGNLGAMLGPDRLPVVPASLAVGPADAFRAFKDEIEPRRDLKRSVGAMPAIDRSHKGDPNVGLRPTFDTRMRDPRRIGPRAAERRAVRNRRCHPDGRVVAERGRRRRPRQRRSFRAVGRRREPDDGP